MSLKFLSYAILFAVASLQAGERHVNPDNLEYPAAVLARKHGRPVVVFVDGSNWAQCSTSTLGAFKAHAVPLDTSLDADFALADITDPRSLTERVNFHGLSPAPWRIPAIYVLDADGRTGALVQGVETSDEVKKFCANLPALVAASKERTKLFAEADKATGPKAAELIGKGLDTLSLRLARQHQDRIRKLSEADPKDTTGYVGKYGFNRDRFHDKVRRAFAGEKPDDGAILSMRGELDALLKNPRMTPEVRQEVQGVLFAIAKRKGDTKDALAILNEIVATDPKSDMAAGAEWIKKALTEETKLEAKEWHDFTAYDMPMRFDVGLGKAEKGRFALTIRCFGHPMSFPGGSELAVFSGKNRVAGQRFSSSATVAGKEGYVLPGIFLAEAGEVRVHFVALANGARPQFALVPMESLGASSSPKADLVLDAKAVSDAEEKAAAALLDSLGEEEEKDGKSPSVK